MENENLNESVETNDEAAQGEAYQADKQTLGQAIDVLYNDLISRKGQDISKSYTAKLLKAGPHKCAKKLGEEAVELALAIVNEGNEEIKNEAADMLYHFMAALISKNVNPNEIATILQSRRGVGGLIEKASRKAKN